MHSYSVDLPRWKLHLGIGVIAVFIGGAAELTATYFFGSNARGLSPFAIGVGLYLVFDRWLWRYPPFTWAHSIPDLTGTWEGEIESSYSPEDADGLSRIDSDGSRLEITQRWSKIEIRYWNPESSHSWSFAAHFKTETGEPKITYVYTNEPEGEAVASPQSSHEGTATLRVLEDGEGRELRGAYYTDQEGEQTYGIMCFEEIDD